MQKRTILIIEDNEINRDILEEILSADYNLLMAEDGRKGLDQLRQNVKKIDVVLLDIMMPVMDGYQVLEEVNKDESLQHIPIIVTTGDEGQGVEEYCLKLHATDFIKKPYNPLIVRLRIENLIRMRYFAATLNDVEIDKQTGIYTRNAFMLYAQEWINNHPDANLTLAMTDVRGFKRLSEQFGDKAYEILRKEVASIRYWYPNDTIIGLYNLDQILYLHPTATNDWDNLDKEEWYEQRFTKFSNNLDVTFKAGICEGLDTSVPLSTHVQNVAVALYSVKNTYNRHVRFVGKELLDKIQRDARIEQLMEEALREGQMQVYYQPKHDAKSEKLVGAEALLRWISPELGFISPGEFIPVFEKNGFVSEADAFVWHETCMNQRRWIDKGLKVVPISVNVSRQDFARKDLREVLSGPMQEFGIDTHLMHLEITESLFDNLSADAVNLLHECREKNIMVELDDFGTGYSSLNSLSELPIDIVKFDMSFVRKLNDPRKYNVMKGCVAITKDLKLKSVAEGVEDAETRQTIADMGIDAIQGYYYSKPIPAAAFEEYLTQHQE